MFVNCRFSKLLCYKLHTVSLDELVMAKTREVELKVGRRSTDGIVRLSAYPPHLVQLSVTYKAQQAASVLLTQEQIRALRDALTDYVEEIEPDTQTNETWDGTERRSADSLLSDALNCER